MVFLFFTEFRNKKGSILVATDVAARGLGKILVWLNLKRAVFLNYLFSSRGGWARNIISLLNSIS